MSPISILARIARPGSGSAEGTARSMFDRGPGSGRLHALAVACVCLIGLASPGSGEPGAVARGAERVPLLAPPPDTLAVILGSVADLGTARPVAGALVLLRDEESRSRSILATDENGRFAIRDIPPGRYRLEASRWGYRTFEEWVVLVPGEERVVDVELAAAAIELEPVVVSAPARSPRIEAFYQRRDRGIGRFLAREEIEARNAGRVTDLLRTMAGVRIVAGPRFSSRVLLRNCQPDLFIDGVHVAPPANVDDLVFPGDLEGVEVYGLAEVPPEFTRGTCGALVLWTRVGTPGEGEPFSWRRLLAAAGIILGVIILR